MQSDHYGAAASGVVFAPTTIAAAWNVQARVERSPFADEVGKQLGIALPVEPNTTARSDGVTALWLGPLSWLVLAADALSLGDFAAKRDALNAAGGALFDVGAS